MTDRQEIYFELFDSGNLIRVEPIAYANCDAEIDWEKNWITTKVTVQGGKFSGQYLGDFRTVDFEEFKQELSLLYDNLNGTAHFHVLESYLELKIKGDGIGHFEVEVTACDEPGVNASELTFTMSFDQTELSELINQLTRITQQFPVIGDFKL